MTKARNKPVTSLGERLAFQIGDVRFSLSGGLVMPNVEPFTAHEPSTCCWRIRTGDALSVLTNGMRLCADLSAWIVLKAELSS